MTLVAAAGSASSTFVRWRLANLAVVVASLAGAVLLFVLGASDAGAAPSSAAPSGSAAPSTVQGLAVAVSGTASAPALVLTNRSAKSCQIADTAVGTAGIASIAQAGASISPITTSATESDTIAQFIRAHLLTLKPGASRTVALQLAPVGATGTALEVLSSSDAGPTVALYPIDPKRPLQIAATYALPIMGVLDVPPCVTSDVAPRSSTLSAGGPTGSSGSTGSSTSAASSGSGGSSGAAHGRWALIGGAIAAAVLIALVALLLAKRRSSRAGAAVILLALALVAATARAPRASASITPDSNSATGFARCGAIFAGPGGDPAGIIAGLQGAGVNVRIEATNGDSHEIKVPGTNEIILFWNQNDTHAYAGGGNAEACSTLYHELFHSSQAANGTLVSSNCWTAGPNGVLVDSGISTAEVEATRAQNQYRVTHGQPARTTYGENPLPSGTCMPPPPPPPTRPPACTGKGCAGSNGDPHLTTFDGAHYDFQGAGEFVAALDPQGGYQIQVRQQPYPGSRTIAVNTAIAMDVAGDHVELDTGQVAPAVLVDGVVATTAQIALLHGGAVSIESGAGAEVFTVNWPDGTLASVTQIGNYGLKLLTKPADAHAGKLTGLLGDFDGDPANDVRSAGGAVIAQPSFGTLYPAFADSWRITQADSLFSYPSGKSTSSYTDKAFPSAAASLSNAGDPAAAKAICLAAGVVDATSLADCAFDVALTGRTEFAGAYSGGQGAPAVGDLAIDGPAVTANVTAAVPAVHLHFVGQAGQEIYVQVTKSTLPDQCGVLQLDDPSGHSLASGCIITGVGSIERTVLPAAGDYIIAIQPTGTGSVTVAIVSDTSQGGAIVADGGPVTATIAQAGAKATFTFQGAAGQQVFVDITGSTFADQCGIVQLRDPSDASVDSGCSINGAGDVDGSVLPQAGTYTLTVVPSAGATGQLTMRLVTDVNQKGTIAVNGPAVTATIQQPGALSTFTFTGTAGQKVAVAVSRSTFADQCGLVQLVDPSGNRIDSGCSIGGAGSIDPTVLATSGVYAIVVDPQARSTGALAVRVTG
jgi:hypothetical protein